MEIIRHIPEVVELCHNQTHVAYLNNEIELMHVQIQIAENKLDGYSIKWRDQEIPIDTTGNLLKWPKGMYDQSTNLMRRLLNARLSRM